VTVSARLTREEQTSVPAPQTQLHKALKQHYASDTGETEVRVGDYVVDVLKDGCIYEIQTANLGALRQKLMALSRKHPVCLVCPIPAVRVISRPSIDGETLAARRSPKKGSYVDAFNELVHLTGVLPGRRLTLELLLVRERQLRVDNGLGSWRRKGVSIVERQLVEILDSRRLSKLEDYRALLPSCPEEPFTSRQLAECSGIPVGLARKALYFLSRSGGLVPVRRTREGIWYQQKAEVT